MSRFLNVLKNLLSGLKLFANLLHLDLEGIDPKKTVSSHPNPLNIRKFFGNS